MNLFFDINCTESLICNIDIIYASAFIKRYVLVSYT